MSKSFKTLIHCLALAALVLLVSSRASADLTFTLTPSLRYGTPGSSVIYTGKLTYTDLTALFYNDISVTFDGGAGAFLTPDYNVFFANVPGNALDDPNYSGPIFGIDLAPNTPYGVFTGTVTIKGGPNPGDTNDLASQPFTLTTTPEPGTFALFVAGGGLVLFKFRRRPIQA